MSRARFRAALGVTLAVAAILPAARVRFATSKTDSQIYVYIVLRK